MKKNYFYIYLVLLLVLLSVVVFYMLLIHVPYYNHTKDVNDKVVTIIEENGYSYLDYSSEYRGYETLYIVRVQKDGIHRYVAYNENLEFVDEYTGNTISKDIIKANVKEKYNFEADKIEVGYENEQFVYYTSYQDKESLLYVYYSIETGEFIKAVGIGE